MRESTVILDPTNEQEPIRRPLAPRVTVLRGSLGLVDISKSRGEIFCDELQRLIVERNYDIEIVRFRKPTFTKPAPPALRNEIAARCTAIIQALAD